MWTARFAFESKSRRVSEVLVRQVGLPSMGYLNPYEARRAVRRYAKGMTSDVRHPVVSSVRWDAGAGEYRVLLSFRFFHDPDMSKAEIMRALKVSDPILFERGLY